MYNNYHVSTTLKEMKECRGWGSIGELEGEVGRKRGEMRAWEGERLEKK